MAYLQGEPLPQSTLKSMRDRNNSPPYIQTQLQSIYEERLEKLKSLERLVYAYPYVKKADS